MYVLSSVLDDPHTETAYSSQKAAFFSIGGETKSTRTVRHFASVIGLSILTVNTFPYQPRIGTVCHGRLSHQGVSL